LLARESTRYWWKGATIDNIDVVGGVATVNAPRGITNNVAQSRSIINNS